MVINESQLRKVAEYRREVYEPFTAFINRFPDDMEWFAQKFDDLAWRYKFIGSYRNHISLTAVPLAEKIYTQMNIVVFPFIHRVACRGWDTAGGTWAWAMDTRIDSVGSADPVKYLLKKNIKLHLLDSGEIVGQK